MSRIQRGVSVPKKGVRNKQPDLVRKAGPHVKPTRGEPQVCALCHGHGHVHGAQCPVCQGEGEV